VVNNRVPVSLRYMVEATNALDIGESNPFNTPLLGGSV
jgi:hypothetical protein